MRKSETLVVKKIIRFLEIKYPGFYFKTHGGLYQKVGLPDIIGVHEGKFIGVEVKTPDAGVGGLTKLQEKTLQKIGQAGGVSFVACSVEEVERYMEGYIHEADAKTKRGTKKDSTT